jgi:hypothetical protein
MAILSTPSKGRGGEGEALEFEIRRHQPVTRPKLELAKQLLSTFRIKLLRVGVYGWAAAGVRRFLMQSTNLVAVSIASPARSGGTMEPGPVS